MDRMVFLEKHCKELESVQGVVSVTLDSTIQRVQPREATPSSSTLKRSGPFMTVRPDLSANGRATARQIYGSIHLQS
jgi:hypothetical protein